MRMIKIRENKEMSYKHVITAHEINIERVNIDKIG